MLHQIMIIFLPIFEAGMYFLLFEGFLERKTKETYWQIYSGVLILAIMIACCNKILGVSIANLLAMAIVSIVVARTLYSGPFTKILMAVALCIVISVISEGVVVYLIGIISGQDAATALINPFYWGFGMLGSKTTGIAICNIIRIKSSVQQANLKKIYWILFFFLFGSVFYASFVIYDFDRMLGDQVNDIIPFLAVVGLFFSTFFTLNLYERLAVQSEELHFQAQTEQQLKYQVRYLDALVARQTQLNRAKHDITNQLLGFKGFLNAGDIDGGKQYIDTLLETLDVISPSVNTGNIALDVILSSKKTVANNQGISFNIEVKVPMKIALSPLDQSIIFGNALDNALEACAKCPEKDRMINFTLLQKGQKLLCEIINTNPNEGDLTTDKINKETHGFGIRNITDALAKYGSAPIIEQSDGWFKFRFIVFNK